jgi:hypothetical protein
MTGQTSILTGKFNNTLVMMTGVPSRFISRPGPRTPFWLKAWMELPEKYRQNVDVSNEDPNFPTNFSRKRLRSKRWSSPCIFQVVVSLSIQSFPVVWKLISWPYVNLEFRANFPMVYTHKFGNISLEILSASERVFFYIYILSSRYNLCGYDSKFQNKMMCRNT